MTEKSQDVPTKENPPRQPARSRWHALLPPLAAALICTALIYEAIETALTGRANGDLMVLICPLLGAVFLSIPATQAWIAAIKVMMGRPKSR